MKILQGGVPKCGNFWLYQIIQQVLKRSGNNNRSFIEQQPIFELAKKWDLNFPEQARIDVLEITDLQNAYRISSVFKMTIENIEEYVKGTSHVWTHSPICKISNQVFRCFDKIVYIIRDPRDRVLSAAKYYCSPYMLRYFPQKDTEPKKFLENNFESLMHEWTWHVFDHLRYSGENNIHIMFYENLLMNFQHELEGLLKYLEIDLSEKERKDLEDAVNFQTLKDKNPKHLNKGKYGYWMSKFSDEQALLTDRIAGPLIKFLRYPEKRGDAYEFLNFSLKNEEIQKSESLHPEIVSLQEQLTN